MVTRGEIIWLGVAAGTTGGLIGGMLLGAGLYVVAEGHASGMISICIGGPVSGLIGWLMARRLAVQVGAPE